MIKFQRLYVESEKPFRQVHLREEVILCEVSRHFWQLLAEESERFFVNRDKGSDACPDGIEMSCGCWMAINKYGGAFGPFQNVTPP